MGVISSSCFDDSVTPCCNKCGIALCWNISIKEYEQEKQFWDAWICKECNGGTALTLQRFKQILKDNKYQINKQEKNNV